MIIFETIEKKENEPQMTAIYFGSEDKPSIVDGTRFAINFDKTQYTIDCINCRDNGVYYAAGEL